MTPEQHQDQILSAFEADFRRKYSRGQLEHGGQLWTKPGILDFALEEAQDLVCYLYTLKQQLQPKKLALPPVIYVAGPFRGKDSYEMECNIRRAEALALEVWRLGCACLCPHTNTRFFQGAADDAIWLDGDLAMLARCDAILMTPDWSRSTGATAEREFAISRGLPVFEALQDLQTWLTARAA